MREAPLFVEIVFVRLPVDLDEVEEELEARLGPDGEVTGAGRGMGRCHLDVEFTAGLDRDEALDRLRSVLLGLGITKYATLNVGT